MEFRDSLEGSLRRLGPRVRITSQLIDAGSGAHLRADQFDGRADDLFDFLDEIVASTVGAIEPSLLCAEAERVRNWRPESMGAYQYYLRAMALMGHAFTNPTGGAIDEAREFLARAVELSPNYAPALALAGYFEAKAGLRPPFRQGGRREARAQDSVERAVTADPDEPLALGAYGFVSANSRGDLDKAAAYIERATTLNSNSPLLWNFAGEVSMYIGEHERAIRHLHRSTPAYLL